MRLEEALAILETTGYEYGPLTRQQIENAVQDEKWQDFRKRKLKGRTTVSKILYLRDWYEQHNDTEAEVQITNYLNALKRGGQLY